MTEIAEHIGSGKVRELYQLKPRDLGDDRLELIATDRISAFDVILPTDIPHKGCILTGLSAFWFSRTEHICPNHLLELRNDGRGMVCRKLQMLPIECVVRGYVTGSAWRDYLATGATSGHVLPAGLLESQRLPEPLFTPATKAEHGTHDENIDTSTAADLVGADLLAKVVRVSLALYQFAAAYAAERGIIIADTKFEFGQDARGELVLADEVLTPDSSRFWPADTYEPGRSQSSFDKQFVRDYCESLNWDKTPPGPELPLNVVNETHARYVDAFERITALSFESYLADPTIILAS